MHQVTPVHRECHALALNGFVATEAPSRHLRCKAPHHAPLDGARAPRGRSASLRRRTTALVARSAGGLPIARPGMRSALSTEKVAPS